MILMVYYRRNLLVLSLTSFLAACGLNQVVPFLPLFIKELGVKSGVAFWTGVTLAAQTVAMIVMLPYWGKLADKYGRKLMIIRAGICAALIYLGMSYCWTLWQLLLLRLLNGGLTGFIPASITLIGTNTPQPEAVRSVAIVQSAVACGVIAGPALGGILANWVGYRGSMLASGIMLSVGVLLVVLLVEERQKVTDVAKSTSLWQDFRLALKKPVLVMALCSDMTYGFLAVASQPILILYIQELTGPRANLFAGPIFALPGLAIVLTNYRWCRLGERHTFLRIILLGLSGASLFIVLQGLVRNIWWFAAVYFLAGILAAAISPNTAGLIATKVEADFQGRAFSMQQSSRSLGYFFAPLLAGSLGSIFPLQGVFIVVGFLGLTAALAIQMQVRACRYSEAGLRAGRIVVANPNKP
jgi:DHA1 family multidrug resistance protein-like MFS transporter